MGEGAVPELDERTRRLVKTAARLFLAQWEPGTGLGDRFEESLRRAAEQVAGDESQVITEFYRVALQDPEVRDALRRAVRAAVYLDPGPAPEPLGQAEDGPRP